MKNVSLKLDAEVIQVDKVKDGIITTITLSSKFGDDDIRGTLILSSPFRGDDEGDKFEIHFVHPE